MGDYILTKDGKLYHCDTSKEVEELMHHGIKDMKWGVRRYQNKDGSLTAAGRVRYGASKVGEVAKKVGAKAGSAIKKKREERRVEKLRKKPLSKLTDAELKERIARLTEEKKAFDLTKSITSIDQNQAVTGKRFVNGAINKVVTPAMVDAGKQVLTSWLKKQGMDLAGLGETKDAFSTLKKEADAINLKRKISDDKKQIILNEDFIKNREKDLADREAKRREKETKDRVDKEINETIRKSEEANEKAKREAKEAEEREAKKVYTGKVSGKGTSKRKSENTKKEKPSDYYDPIETYFVDRDEPVSSVRNSRAYNTGLAAVNRLLLKR